MGISGSFTAEGLTETQKSRDQGWGIFPSKGLVSETAGSNDYINRTLSTVNTPFYQADLSTAIVQSYTDIKFNFTIPPNLMGGNKTVAEMYVFGESQGFNVTTNYGANNYELSFNTAFGSIIADTGDQVTVRVPIDFTGTLPSGLVEGKTYWIRLDTDGTGRLFNSKSDADTDTNPIDLGSDKAGTVRLQKEFLLAVGQPDETITYKPAAGGILLRPTFRLAVLGDTNLFTFNYTQAQEIDSHNQDPNAHPGLLGKALIRNILFDTSVNNLDAVYIDTDGIFYQALADATIKESNFMGIRFGSNIIFKGKVTIPGHGFSVGQKLYLSASTPGAISTTISNLLIGTVLDIDNIMIDKNLAGATINSTYLALTDTDNDYTGLGGTFLKVKATEDGIEAVAVALTDTLVSEYADVATLKGVNTTGFSAGVFVSVSPGAYYRLSKTSTLAEDGFSVIEPTTGAANDRWILQFVSFELFTEYLSEMSNLLRLDFDSKIEKLNAEISDLKETVKNQGLQINSLLSLFP